MEFAYLPEKEARSSELVLTTEKLMERVQLIKKERANFRKSKATELKFAIAKRFQNVDKMKDVLL